MNQKIAIKKYNSRFKAYFQSERNFLIGKIKNIEIHHVGSTAVPGLGGKNVLDILVLVPLKKDSIHIKKRLESIGYYYNKDGGNAQRIFFNKDRSFNKKKIHIHLHLMWKSFWKYKEYFLFRDYLMRHPEEAERYFTLKKKLIKKVKGVRVKYTKAKGSYIENVIRKAKVEKI